MILSANVGCGWVVGVSEGSASLSNWALENSGVQFKEHTLNFPKLSAW